MAGTRTAPAATASANAVSVTLHLIDASGDQFTDNITVTAAPTPAVIEAWAVAYQAASQASLWKVTTESQWVGDADPDNAEALFRGSVKDGINLLYKNTTTLKAITPRLVAPIAGIMQGNQDIPILTATEAAAVVTAELAILTGFTLQSAQFTERRERSNNPRIKV